jgi:uncharacterized protein YndB with AHSA1/START domain
MTVTNIEKDRDQLTMTIVSEFDAPVTRVWQLWDDPRQLERWWGPPEYPATFVDHELAPGGRVSYFMTGPEGDQPHGWWSVTAVDAPRHLVFEDGFAHDDGTPNPDMPVMTMRVSLDELADGGTRMAIETKFASVEEMEQIVTMGMEEGMASALAQIDGILAAITP